MRRVCCPRWLDRRCVRGCCLLWRRDARAGSVGVRDLGTLGGTDSVASDINGRGQIVGYSDTKLKDAIGNERDHAFLWQNGRMRDLGTLGGEDSAAEAINERGQVVGWADTRMRGRNGEQVAHAFLWENGTMHDLGTFGGPSSSASDIDDGGQIVGWADTRVEDPFSYAARANAHHAFLRRNGRLIDLGTFGGPNSEASALNDRGAITGWAETKAKLKEFGYVEFARHAFLWQGGRKRDLGVIGGPRSEANGVNENSQVVGSLDTGRKDTESKYGDEPIWHAFLWQNGRMRDLTPGGPFSFAGAINGLGQIAGSGTAQGENQDSRASVWQNGKRIRAGTLGFGSEAVSINARGQAAGWSETRDWDKHAVLWTRKRG